MKESQFVYLQFKVAVETCRLRVLNNDSGQELPTVLHWVAPTEYQPNTVRKCSVLNEGITFSVHLHITCDIRTYILQITQFYAL